MIILHWEKCMQEALFEVMPTQKVVERTFQEEYFNDYQRDQLEMSGYIPVDPSAKVGIAIKTIRELVV